MALVKTAFGGLTEEIGERECSDCNYAIERAPEGGFRISKPDQIVLVNDEDGLLFHLDGEIVLALQYQRSDLLFLHAAAVASADRVAILSAPSGTGKSTLALAAVREGLDYLSDELAPIDLKRFTVEAYPRALCLKAPPPPPQLLPRGTIQYGDRYHVPIETLARTTRKRTRRLSNCVFLERRGGGGKALRPITRASATARLMANTLNSLAHPNNGFDAAVALGEAVPCFELDVGDLPAATAAVKHLLLG